MADSAMALVDDLRQVHERFGGRSSTLSPCLSLAEWLCTRHCVRQVAQERHPLRVAALTCACGGRQEACS